MDFKLTIIFQELPSEIIHSMFTVSYENSSSKEKKI